MLDLADDCSRFVTGYFEIISTSSPHIYHSALVLAPKASIVRKLYYEPHAHPFVRVVHGLPVSWDPTTAATTRPSRIVRAVWSPCSRFIAIIQEATTMVDILDSTTLQRLRTLEFPQDISPVRVTPVFSPDSRTLTCSSGLGRGGRDSHRGVVIINWDLQTGGVASVIRGQRSEECMVVGPPSIAYSAGGGVVGVFYWHDILHPSTLFIFDVVSGTHTHSHSLDGRLLYDIWTHGESLRFATVRAGAVLIWEVGFASGEMPTKVETFSTPSSIYNAAPSDIGHNDLKVTFEILPARSRLGIACKGRVLVWDGRNSRSLLLHTDIKHHRMSFSSDDSFVACSTTESEIYLWKQSPAGYLLHGALTPGAGGSTPLLSPNGESIVVVSGHMIRLWRTRASVIPPASASVRAPEHAGDFALEFSQDGEFAVALRRGSNAVTVLGPKSGLPPLTINTNLRAYGLRMVGDAAVLLGDGKAIVWDLSCAPKDGVKGIIFHDEPQQEGGVLTASLSPDLGYVALATRDSMRDGYKRLGVYPWEFSGGSLHCTKMDEGTPWFCVVEAAAWEITMNRDKDPASILKVSHVDLKHPPEGCPWRPPRGYQTTDDGWVHGPDERRLLMLPSLWRSYHTVRQEWNGQFLALLHGTLPEPVILELDP